MDLGTKRNTDLYPTMAEQKEEPQVSYPSITLPLELVGDDIDLDKEITIKITGKVTRVEKSEYYKEFTIKATDGEVI